MSTDIYGSKIEAHPEFGQVSSAVFDFKHWQSELLHDDADARSERGEDPFYPNPDFIPDSAMNVSVMVAGYLGEGLGHHIDDDSGPFRIPMETVTASIADLKARQHNLMGYLPRIESLVEKSLAQGATHLSFS